MSQFFNIHPANPQPHLISAAADVVRRGGIIIYPTDSAYALGCRLDDKTATARIRQLRQLDDKHLLTLVCRDLSEVSNYAVFDSSIYRLLKAHTPGPYTFILKATSEVPRRLQHPKRKTVGLRVPEHRVAQALLEVLAEPLISATLMLPGADMPVIEPNTLPAGFSKQIDAIIDSGFCGIEPTSIIDCVAGAPSVLRVGKGDVTAFI